MAKNTEIEALKFYAGELYLFHKTDPHCPSDSSIWGIFDCRQSDRIYTESTSCDLLTFSYNTPLPTLFRYARCATRSELRDYIFNLSWFEAASRNKATPSIEICKGAPSKVCKKSINGGCERAHSGVCQRLK